MARKSNECMNAIYEKYLPSVGTINGNAMNCGTLKEMIQSSHSNMSG